MGRILRFILSFFIGKRIISIGTDYRPTTEDEEKYVKMMNDTKTMLIELKKAKIDSNSIFESLVEELNFALPRNGRFVELKKPEKDINERALLSDIIVGSDRYLYVELPEKADVNEFIDTIKNEGGEIVEKGPNEILARLISKNEAIKIAIKLIALGSEKNLNVRAAVGMTAAAAVERAIKLTNEVGEIPGVAFTKFGGEFALLFPSKISKIGETCSTHGNYLFLDVINSTKFIEKYGRDFLSLVMEKIKKRIEEREGKIEGYRKGGDDLVASMPTKDLALQAILEAIWESQANDVKIRAGVGKTRKEAGENAYLSDDVKFWHPSSTVVFNLANGTYAYFIPSDFTRTLINFALNRKGEGILIFIFVFLMTFIGWQIGRWELGVIAIILSLIYALIT